MTPPPLAPPGSLLVAMDTETTSFRGEIIEIAAVTQQGACFARRIRPSARAQMHPRAQAAHGIALEDLRACDPWSAVAPACRAFFAEQMRVHCCARIVVAAHNAPFDVRMLKKAERATGESIFPEGARVLVVDTLVLARARRQFLADTLQPHEELSFRLGSLYHRIMGRELVGAHGALADARAVMAILCSGVLVAGPLPAHLLRGWREFGI